MRIETWNRPLREAGPAESQAALLGRGAILCRHPGNTLADFLQWSNALGCDFMAVGETPESRRAVGGNNGRSIVHGDPTLYSVTGADFGYPVPLHGELYFQQDNPPHLFWMFCARAPVRGGETWLCDGAELFAALPAPVQALFLENGIEYERRLGNWAELYATDDPAQVERDLAREGTRCRLNDDGSLSTWRRTPAVRVRAGQPVFINNFLPFALRQIRAPEETRARVRLGNGEPVAPETVLAIERLGAGLTTVLAWQPGDALVLDNTRILHGRAAVPGTVEEIRRREIYVRMSDAAFLADIAPGWTGTADRGAAAAGPLQPN